MRYRIYKYLSGWMIQKSSLLEGLPNACKGQKGQWFLVPFRDFDLHVGRF